MTYTIDEIKKLAIPLASEYKIKSLSLFGSYSKGEANEDSDLDFVMDKGDLKWIEYFSLLDKLEKTFNCHVDLISKGFSNKEFLKSIEKDEVLIYER